MRENNHKIRLPKDMMAIVMENAREQLSLLRVNGTKFKHIAARIAVPNTRISEICSLRYMSEKTLVRLVKHGYLTVSNLEKDLDEEQKGILRELVEPSPHESAP